MCDEDWGVGGRAVPSSCHSVDCDGVVSIRLQPRDGCRSLGAWDCELLGRFTPYIGKNGGRAKVTFTFCMRRKKKRKTCTDLLHR